MPHASRGPNSYRAEQRKFILSGRHAKFGEVRREDIFDSTHVVSQADSIVDLLKNFKSYREAKARFPGGAVFHGPSGTGKTMMARYVATQSKARFIDIRQFPVVLRSGVHVWQPHDIQHLFMLSEEWARRNKRPIVLFLDQFDDWLNVHSAIMSQLEIELDGFSGRREGVYLIVTAKKEPGTFGESLFRSGRIETKVAFSYPDRRQQIELIKGFLGRYPHDSKIDLENLIYLLNMPSPADLKSLVDEAYTLALRERAIKIISEDARVTEEKLLEVAISKVLDPATGHTLIPQEERTTAIHELGHYIVARALGIPAHFVSCKPGLRSLGMTSIGENGLERMVHSIAEIHGVISCFTAGVEAERLFGLPPNTGGGGDNDNATSMMKTLLSTGVDPASPLTKEYGILCFDDEDGEEQGELAAVSENLRVKFEKALGSSLKREKLRARRVLRFFGKRLISKIAQILVRKPSKVMLQKELDRLLEPKLSEFKRRHRVVEIR